MKMGLMIQRNKQVQNPKIKIFTQIIISTNRHSSIRIHPAPDILYRLLQGQCPQQGAHGLGASYCYPV